MAGIARTRAGLLSEDTNVYLPDNAAADIDPVDHRTSNEDINASTTNFLDDNFTIDADGSHKYTLDPTGAWDGTAQHDLKFIPKKWFDDNQKWSATGSHLSPVTPTDSVSIGTSTQQENDILTVIGNTSLSGKLTLEDSAIVDSEAMYLDSEFIGGINYVKIKGVGGDLFSVDTDENVLWTSSDISGNAIGQIDSDWLVKFGNPVNRPFEISYNSTTGKSYHKLVVENYANDASANSDADLPSGGVYTVTVEDRTLRIKP